MELNIQIPGIRNYNEDVLLLVIPAMTYSEMVLVMVGSKIIDEVLSLMTIGELVKVTTTWQQAHFGAVMSGLLQIFHSCSHKNSAGEGAKCSSQRGDPVDMQKVSLDDVKHQVCTTQKVTIPPFSNVNCMLVPVTRDTTCGFMFSWN